MPQQNAVMTITAGVNDMQAVLEAVWTHLLPSMYPVPLPYDVDTADKLAERLQQLYLQAPQQAVTSPSESEFAGHYQLEENHLCWETITIRFDDGEAIIKLKDHNGEHQFKCGRGAWIVQLSRLNQGKEQRIAASFTWSDPNTMELTVRYIETPFCHTAVCLLDGTQITFEIKPNVTFGTRDSIPVRGKRLLTQ